MWRQVVITHRQELKFSIERKFYEMSLQGVEDDLISLQKEFEGALFSTRCVLFSPSLLRSYAGVCCCLNTHTHTHTLSVIVRNCQICFA